MRIRHHTTAPEQRAQIFAAYAAQLGAAVASRVARGDAEGATEAARLSYRVARRALAAGFKVQR